MNNTSDIYYNKYKKYKSKYNKIKIGGNDIEKDFEEFKNQIMKKIVSPDNCKNVTNEILEDKNSSKSQLVILYGPPGSGKTNILSAFESKLNINFSVKILIDLIIVKTKGYEKVTNEIIDTFNKFKKQASTKEELLKVENLFSVLLNETYFKFRKFPNCGDDISNSLYAQAIALDKNIIYEGTGQDSSINWLLRVCENAKKNNYNVTVIFPFIDFDKLKGRVISRFGKIKDNREPRYIDEEKLKKVYEESHANFLKLATSNDIDKVILINNNRNMEQQEDRLNPDNYEILLEKYNEISFGKMINDLEIEVNIKKIVKCNHIKKDDNHSEYLIKYVSDLCSKL